MMQSDNSEDISDTLMSDPETVMKIWFKHNPQDFIQLIVHEAREEIFIIEAFTKVFLEDHDIASQSINSSLGVRTIEENCAVLMRRLARLRQIMAIAWKYSLTQQSEDTKPEV